MAWRRKKRAAPRAEAPLRLPAAQAAPAEAKGPRWEQLPGGTVVTVSAAMGAVYDIPADPRPAGVDISAGAPGWEQLREYRCRRLP
jgi:hypothetical protein